MLLHTAFTCHFAVACICSLRVMSCNLGDGAGARGYAEQRSGGPRNHVTDALRIRYGSVTEEARRFRKGCAPIQHVSFTDHWRYANARTTNENNYNFKTPIAQIHDHR